VSECPLLSFPCTKPRSLLPESEDESYRSNNGLCESRFAFPFKETRADLIPSRVLRSSTWGILIQYFSECSSLYLTIFETRSLTKSIALFPVTFACADSTSRTKPSFVRRPLTLLLFDSTVNSNTSFRLPWLLQMIPVCFFLSFRVSFRVLRR